MATNFKQYVNYFQTGIFFPKKDVKKMERMQNEITIISTVYPDYPNNGKFFTFQGELGCGVSLTAKLHIKHVPNLIAEVTKTGVKCRWIILVADLPELVSSQEEFYLRVADSKDDYLERCRQTMVAIKQAVGARASVFTFSEFYGRKGINYLAVQTEVARRVIEQSREKSFSGKFTSFLISRMPLSTKFRGRPLSIEEHRIAAAHGMSLYITHGTLLKSLYQEKNLIAINHDTTNISNFFLCQFVDGYEKLVNLQNFPIGIIEGEIY